MNISQFGEKDRRTRVGYKDKQKRDAFMQMGHVGDALNLHQAVLQRAKELFAGFRDDRELVQQFKGVVAACLCEAFEQLSRDGQQILKTLEQEEDTAAADTKGRVIHNSRASHRNDLHSAKMAGKGAQGAYDCGFFEQRIREYNAARPWDDPGATFDYHFIVVPNISSSEIADLERYAVENWTPPQLDRWSAYQLNFCMDVHTDGWIAADDTMVDLAVDPHRLVQVTVNGEVECDYGEVLVVQSTYWFYGGAWDWAGGTNWIEDPDSGILISGELSFECLGIFDPQTDVAAINAAVPTTQSNVNPLVDGLTGLETWLWYDFSQIASRELGPYTEAIRSRGQLWTLTTYAWVDRVMWDVDCVVACTFRGMLSEVDESQYDYVLDLDDTAVSPASSYDGGSGTEDGAAAAHIYDTRADYVISTATVWRGYYEFQGVRYRYDPVIVAQGRDYVVHEIRAVPHG